MPRTPLVSIITPSFNQVSFLGECLFSVLTQDYPYVEHLVMDGGSKDGSTDLLAGAYVPRPKRLHWVSQPDGGQAEAVNKGLTIASGEIIGWLNSDDLYVPGAIALAVEHFARHPGDMLLYGEANWIDASGRFLGRYPVRPNGDLAAFRDGCFLCQPAVFFRSALVRKIGLLNASLVTAMDYDYWLRAFQAFPERISHLPRCLAFSRLHNDCKTRSLRRLVHLEGMEVARLHFGEVPIHWVLSWLEEYWDTVLHSPGAFVSRAEVFWFIKEAFRRCSREERRQIKERLRRDKRCALNWDNVRIEVEEDGWTRAECALLIRSDTCLAQLALVVETARPAGGTITVSLVTPEKQVVARAVCQAGALLRITVPAPAGGETMRYSLVCDPTFVAARIDSSSNDRRELSVRIRSAVFESAEIGDGDYNGNILPTIAKLPTLV